MKLYELTYLISPNLSEEEAKSFQEDICSLIQKQEGALEKKETIIKKKLSYPIQKQETAYLATVEFRLDPEKLKDLEKELKSKNQILRFLLLTKKISEIKTISKISKPKLKPKPKQKVKLKEIEDKLEEILKE
ncbi:hypothetical protein AMJ49_04465 [Parcubacteria bacterium DG_74_2]|nr:MAG: hypothetical protein AMJ49_04465 [Parcubacteria bacterium DG_74_2]